MIEFVIWTLLTLGIVTLTIILAERYGLEIAIGIFATLTVVANIVSSKLVAIGALIGPAGVIVYSATFLVTDIISEIYGKEYGKRAVITGFFANLVAVSAIMTAVLWTPANVPGNLETAKAFEKVFGLAPRIVFASMVAYIIAQMNDVKNKIRKNSKIRIMYAAVKKLNDDQIELLASYLSQIDRTK